MVKNLLAIRRHRDLGSIPGSGRSPGKGNGNPLWYSCLGKPRDRGTWRNTVHGITESYMTEQLHTHTHRLDNGSSSNLKKQNFHMTHQFHSWEYIKKKKKTTLIQKHNTHHVHSSIINKIAKMWNEWIKM